MPAHTYLVKSGWLADQGYRLEAAAYGEGGLAARDHIKAGPWPWEPLEEMATAYLPPRFTRRYVNDPVRGVPLLSSSDMLLADLQGLPLLSRKAAPNLDALTSVSGSTLISRSGTIGRTVYWRQEMDGMAVSEDVIHVRPRQGHVRPGYLFAFLASAPAQAMIRQQTYGSVVQHIEPRRLAGLPVPLPDAGSQRRIHELVEGAAAKRSEASSLLDEASEYFDRSFATGGASHYHSLSVGAVQRSALERRLDAFHHMGWAAVPPMPGPQLRELAAVWSVSSMRRVWAPNGVPFVTGTNVFALRPDPERRLAKWAADEVNAYVQEGDLLLQAYGQLNGLIGHPCYVGSRLSGWSAGHLLFRIRVSIPGERGRVFSFLRSDVGRRALVRWSSGNQIPHLVPDALRRLVTPPLPAELTEKSNRALRLREEADANEERAIREVEAWLG